MQVVITFFLMINSIPYLLLALVLFFLYLGEKGRIRGLRPKTSIWVAYILMWLFVGLRGHMMSDFIIYWYFFKECPDLFHLTSTIFHNRIEPGFFVYTSIFKLFSNNYFVWVAFNTLIDLVVLAWFFRRYCRSMVLPLIFFIAFNGLTLEFNLYRNMKSIDLFLLSLPYLQRRRFLPYLLLNLLGSTIHSSSFLYIPCYFILARTMGKAWLWGLFIVSNILFLGNISIIGTVFNNLSIVKMLAIYDRVNGYSGNAQVVKFSMGYFERTFSFLLFTWIYFKYYRHHRTFTIFYNSYFIYYCTFLIFYEVQVFVDRIPTLFIYSYWVLYSTVSVIHYKYSRVISLIISMFVISKLLLSFQMRTGAYQNILWTKPDFVERMKMAELDTEL